VLGGTYVYADQRPQVGRRQLRVLGWHVEFSYEVFR
jgi:hypothetical protein